MTNEVTMPTETLNKVVGYLRSCPYGHVAQLMNEINTFAKPVKKEEKEEKAEEAPQESDATS